MTDPADLVELLVPPASILVGDLLDDEHADGPVEQVIVDAVPGFVYAFAPQQVPLRRDVLVRVHRRRADPTPAAGTVAEQLAEVRDLALALADAASAQGASVDTATARVTRARDKVRARLEETDTDGTAGPGAPVLRQPAAPAGAEPVAAPAVQPAPAAGAGAPAAPGPTTPANPGSAGPDRRGGRAG